MDATRLIQAAVVRADIAIVAAWHVLRIALPVLVAVAIFITALRRLRPGR